MRTMLFGDWGTKGLALVMAVFLWSYLYWQRHTAVEKQVPIEVTFTNPDIFSVQPIRSDGGRLGTITLLINAERILTDELENLDVRCRIALADSAFGDEPQGRFTVTLSDANIVNLPGSATVKFLPSVEITVEYVKYVIPDTPVPVLVGDIIDPRIGYRRGRIEIDPPAVRVRLPAVVTPPESLRLPQINLTQRSASVRLTTRPLVPEGVELVDDEVSVDIEILEDPLTKSLRPKIRVVWEKPDPRVTHSLKQEDIRVELKGTPEELAHFTDESVLVVTVTEELVRSALGQNDPYIKTMEEGLILMGSEAVRLLKKGEWLDEIQITLKVQ